MSLAERWHQLRADPRRWVAALAGLVLVVQLVLRGWAGYRGYFYIDDFAFTGRAARFGLSPDRFLFQSYNSHLMPAAFVEVWLLSAIWPLQFAPVVTLGLALQAVLGVLFYRLLVALFGPRAGILVPFTVFVLSPITLPAFLWWAAALNQLPQQIAMAGALLLHVRYLRTGQVRKAVFAVLAIAGGLLFSEKTLLAVPLIVALTFAFAATGPPLARVRQVGREHRRVWLAYAVLCVPYVLYYVIAVPSPGRSDVKGSALVSLGATALRDGLLPGLLGGPWTWRPYPFASAFAAPGPLAAFVSGCVVVGVIATTVAARRGAASAWWIGAGYFVADVLLLGLTRAQTYGALASEYRYFTDCALVCSLALALATMPIAGTFARGSVLRLDRRHWVGATLASARVREVRRLVPSPGRLVVVLALVVATCVSATVSTVHFDRYWRQNPARPYLSTLQDGLNLVGDHVTLYDQPVPQPVVWGVLAPYATLSRVLAPLRHHPSYLRPGHPSASLAVVDDTGHLRRAAIDGATNRPGPRKNCGYEIHHSTVTVPMRTRTLDGTWVLRIGYLSGGSAAIQVTAGARTQTVFVTKGVNNAYLIVSGRIDRVRIASSRPDLYVCTDEVSIGFPYPIPGSSV